MPLELKIGWTPELFDTNRHEDTIPLQKSEPIFSPLSTGSSLRWTSDMENVLADVREVRGDIRVFKVGALTDGALVWFNG